MIFTLSIGNSTINMGCFEDDRNIFTASISTFRKLTSYEYANSISQILKLHNISNCEIEGAIISSVVPVLTNTLKETLEFLFSCKVLVLSSGIKTGLNIRYKNSRELGSDFVCNAVATLSKYKTPCVIFSLGTVTTACVIDENGVLLGTSIMAGLQMSLDALCTNTARLPEIGIEKPTELIGQSTIDAMSSGLIYGTASMLDGMVDKYSKLFSQELNVVVTGRYTKYVLPYCERKYIYDENLNLRGLNLIYKKNQKHR